MLNVKELLNFIKVFNLDQETTMVESYDNELCLVDTSKKQEFVYAIDPIRSKYKICINVEDPLDSAEIAEAILYEGTIQNFMKGDLKDIFADKTSPNIEGGERQ